MLRSIVCLFPVLLLSITGCGPGAPRSELVRWQTAETFEVKDSGTWQAAEGFTGLLVRLRISAHTLYRGEGEFVHLTAREFELKNSAGEQGTLLGHRTEMEKGFTDSSMDVIRSKTSGMQEIELAFFVPSESIESDTFTLTYHEMPPVVLTREKRVLAGP